MKLVLVAAMDRDGVIGAGGDLPWRLPADLAHFKRTTLGHHILMGRRTFASIGRPLPGRTTLVLSRSPERSEAGCTMVSSLQEAQAAAEAAGVDTLMVCGGAAVYELALPNADALAFTRVQAAVGGDTFFPPVPWDLFRLTSRVERPADDANPFDLVFEDWARRA